MVNASSAPEAVIQVGDLIAGKYRVEHVLASGGMGVVVAARHVHLAQRVAVKYLHPEMLDRPELVARFLREGRASVELQGEHTVRVFDVGMLDFGSPYIVMEYLKGQDLQKELLGEGQLPVDLAIDYVLQAAEALAEAHAKGIVHRDIKPSNLFLAEQPDGSRIVKVVDFGISKLLYDQAQEGLDQKLTTTSAMLGSPQYMSPEQVRSARDVDHRTDIWSLGCVLYELVAGAPPFSGDSVSALSAQIVADPPTPLGAYRSDAPAQLEIVIGGCLKKARGERFQSAAELARALQHLAPESARVSLARIERISNRPRSELDWSGPPSHPDSEADTLAVVDGVERIGPTPLPVATARSDASKSFTRRRSVPSRRRLHVFGALGALVVLAVVLAFVLVQSRQPEVGGAVADSEPTSASQGQAGPSIVPVEHALHGDRAPELGAQQAEPTPAAMDRPRADSAGRTPAPIPATPGQRQAPKTDTSTRKPTQKRTLVGTRAGASSGEPARATTPDWNDPLSDRK